MSEKPKRKFWQFHRRHWYQFHLSTVIVTTLMASCFLKLNMTLFMDFLAERPLGKTYGWPLGCWGDYHRARTGRIVEFHFWPALVNLLAALLIIILTASILEWLLRRREARKV